MSVLLLVTYYPRTFFTCFKVTQIRIQVSFVSFSVRLGLVPLSLWDTIVQIYMPTHSPIRQSYGLVAVVSVPLKSSDPQSVIPIRESCCDPWSVTYTGVA